MADLNLYQEVVVLYYLSSNLVEVVVGINSNLEEVVVVEMSFAYFKGAEEYYLLIKINQSIIRATIIIIIVVAKVS